MVERSAFTECCLVTILNHIAVIVIISLLFLHSVIQNDGDCEDSEVFSELFLLQRVLSVECTSTIL